MESKSRIRAVLSPGTATVQLAAEVSSTAHARVVSHAMTDTACPPLPRDVLDQVLRRLLVGKYVGSGSVDPRLWRNNAAARNLALVAREWRDVVDAETARLWQLARRMLYQLTDSVVVDVLKVTLGENDDRRPERRFPWGGPSSLAEIVSWSPALSALERKMGRLGLWIEALQRRDHGSHHRFVHLAVLPGDMPAFVGADAVWCWAVAHYVLCGLALLGVVAEPNHRFPLVDLWRGWSRDEIFDKLATPQVARFRDVVLPWNTRSFGHHLGVAMAQLGRVRPAQWRGLGLLSKVHPPGPTPGLSPETYFVQNENFVHPREAPYLRCAPGLRDLAKSMIERHRPAVAPLEAKANAAPVLADEAKRVAF